MWIFGPFWVRVTLSLIFPPCIVSNGTDVQHWVGLSNLTICITLWRHTGITFRCYCKEKHSVSSLIHLFCIWSWLFTKLVIPVRKKSVSKSGRALCLQIKCKILWHPHSFRCPVKARPWSDVSQEAAHSPLLSISFIMMRRRRRSKRKVGVHSIKAAEEKRITRIKQN